MAVTNCQPSNQHNVIDVTTYGALGCVLPWRLHIHTNVAIFSFPVYYVSIDIQWHQKSLLRVQLKNSRYAVIYTLAVYIYESQNDDLAITYDDSCLVTLKYIAINVLHISLLYAVCWFLVHNARQRAVENAKLYVRLILKCIVFRLCVS